MSDYEYPPRLMDAQLNETLDYIGAVLIGIVYTYGIQCR